MYPTCMRSYAYTFVLIEERKQKKRVRIAKWMIAKEICLIVISKYVKRWNSFENQSIAKNDL